MEPLGSTIVWVVAVLALAAGASAQPDRAVCHDGKWDRGEFCGRDAWLVTGHAEMNHDCTVDLLDLPLWLREFALIGPNLSGDLDGNGLVSLTDLAMLLSTFGNSVLPCIPSGMLPDQCIGTIALSFSSNPANIDSTHTQAPGAGRVYVVTSGWTEPAVIEYAVEASANVTIVDHPLTPLPHWQLAGQPVACDPDSRHSWRGFIADGGPWPLVPIVYDHIDYTVSDANPAWIQLVPVPACWGNSRIRWAVGAANYSADFENVLNVGINGPPPPGVNTCIIPPPPIPALGPHALWLLPAMLLGIAAITLGRARAARVSERHTRARIIQS
jgi:hypothetical protein